MNKKTEAIRAIKFVLFSASAGIIEAASFALLYDLLHWNWTVSYTIALVLSVLWNFTLNREYTFKSANNIPIAMLKVAAYYAVFAPLTIYGGRYLEGTLGWDGNIVTILNMALNLITEFLYQRYYVYGKDVDQK